MSELALTMPKMSMTMEEGTVVAWLKQPGDAVRQGDVVLEVATDKVDMEVESPFEGTISRVVAEVDDVVPVGEPLCFIESESDDLLGGLLGPATAGAGAETDTGGSPAAAPVAPAAASAPVPPSPPAAPAPPTPPAPPVAPVQDAASAGPAVPDAGAGAAPGELALTMPKMSMTMEEGTVVAWLKRPGDAVRQGDPVLEVATDKVDMEVESPFDGVLARIVAQENDVVAVGEPLAWIASESDDLLGGLLDGSGVAAPAASAAPGRAGDVEPNGSAPAPAGASASGVVPAVPAARRLAAERGIDLALVPATGPWGSVRFADVEGFSAQPRTSPVASASAPTTGVEQAPAAAALSGTPEAVAELETAMRALESLARRLGAGVGSGVGATAAASEPAGPAAPTSSPARAAARAAEAGLDRDAKRRLRVRRQLAKAMNASAAVPQFTVFVDVDLEPLARIRKTELGGASWTAILVRAQALALSDVPALLGRWDEDAEAVVPDEGIGVALAVDSPNGLVAPVVRDPHRMPLADVASGIRALVTGATEGSLAADALAGGTTVFSNLGGFGVDRFNALITPPHATAMSAGSITRRMHVFDDASFAPRLQATLGLTVDHRVADGADAARFTQALRAVLADPARLRG